MAIQQRDHLSGVTAVVYNTISYNSHLKRNVLVERRYVLGQARTAAIGVLAECHDCFSIEGTIARLTCEGYAHFERGLREEGVEIKERRHGGHTHIYLKATRQPKSTGQHLALPEDEAAAAAALGAEAGQTEGLPEEPEEDDVAAVVALLGGDVPNSLVRGLLRGVESLEEPTDLVTAVQRESIEEQRRYRTL